MKNSLFKCSKKITILLPLLLLFSTFISANAHKKGDYVVITSNEIKNDEEWMKVVSVLAKRHNATTLFYDRKPEELLDQLKKITPRYVAIVEKPENLNRDYVLEGHRLSRKIDNDIYADYLWGIITGYDAQSAMKLVQNSEKPYTIKTALMTANQLIDGKWFEKFAYLNDNVLGEWGEKKSVSGEVSTNLINKKEILNKWVEKYNELDPDFIISSAHATEYNLEMPYSAGMIKSKNGQLYADFPTAYSLKGTNHPRVYFPAGNCLIGNIDNSKESMAVAWLSGGDVTSMVGYVVPTWYGRNGWGGLKYFASSFGKRTLAEAVYLNQQEMLTIEYEWNPKSLEINYPFNPKDHVSEFNNFKKLFQTVTNTSPSINQNGFCHDRDCVVLYGDPAWDVRISSKSPDYEVKTTIKGNQCILTITTSENFDLEMMRGGQIKQIHVADIPFCYLFPKRLKNPRLSDGQSWNVTLADDFIFINNCDFEKNKTYKVMIDID